MSMYRQHSYEPFSYTASSSRFASSQELQTIDPHIKKLNKWLEESQSLLSESAKDSKSSENVRCFREAEAKLFYIVEYAYLYKRRWLLDNISLVKEFKILINKRKELLALLQPGRSEAYAVENRSYSILETLLGKIYVAGKLIIPTTWMALIKILGIQSSFKHINTLLLIDETLKYFQTVASRENERQRTTICREMITSCLAYYSSERHLSAVHKLRDKLALTEDDDELLNFLTSPAGYTLPTHSSTPSTLTSPKRGEMKLEAVFRSDDKGIKPASNVPPVAIPLTEDIEELLAFFGPSGGTSERRFLEEDVSLLTAKTPPLAVDIALAPSNFALSPSTFLASPTTNRSAITTIAKKSPSSGKK